MRSAALMAAASFLIWLRPAVATVPEIPPLNDQTIIGVWEGFLESPPAPITLFRMEMNATGDSYLVQITPQLIVNRDASYVVYKLVSADSKVLVGQTSTSHYKLGQLSLEMTGTPIDLHFHQISPGPGMHDVWIKGIGVAAPHQEFGHILCTSLGSENVWFAKGKWTEDLGKASEKAADAIRELSK